MADPSIAPTYLLAKVTRQEVTVALGGDGADELFAGYEHFIGFKAAGLYAALPAALRRGLVDPVCARLPASDGYVNLRLGAATFLAGACFAAGALALALALSMAFLVSSVQKHWKRSLVAISRVLPSYSP